MTSKDEVLAAEAARRKAITDADEKALNKIFHEDYHYVHSSGRVEDKASYVGSILPKTFRFTKFEDLPLTVKVYGDTAVVTGENKITREAGGESKVNHFYHVGVWVKGPAGWQCAHYQNVRVPV